MRQLGLRTVGANGGSNKAPGAERMMFSKAVLGPLGMPQQLFLARFEPVLAHFGLAKIPKCLEWMGEKRMDKGLSKK